MSEPKKIKENGRDRLIASSLKLFSEKGFHGCSVREICDAAKTNISLISFHFGSKEGLLEVLFEELLGNHFDEIDRFLILPKTKEDLKVRLSVFLESFLNFYLGHKEVIGLYLEELERGHAQAKEILPETFGKIWESLNKFLLEAQKEKLIDESIDIQILALQIISPFIHFMRSRRSSSVSKFIQMEDETFRKKFVSQIIQVVE